MNILERTRRRVNREVKKIIRKRKMGEKGLCYFEPNYIYSKRIGTDGVVIDVGCSHQAEFSLYMIERHGLTAFGVDPTRKHRPALEELEKKYDGRFIHIPVAVSGQDGSMTFHESKANESGSILREHVNVQSDEIIEYEVETVSLNSLLRRIGIDRIAVLKLDLEGAEYDMLERVSKDDLVPFRQIFIEFHHHAIDNISEKDTERLVERIISFGFESYSLDDHNYLFFDRRV